MKYLRDSDNTDVTVDEGEVCDIVSSFEFGETAFNKDGILTIRLTLYDKESKQIINEREAQDVYDTNGGSLSSEGLLTLGLTVDDNVIIDEDMVEGNSEQHIARLVWTWTGPSGIRTGVEELSFLVQKMAVPVPVES